MLRVFLYFLFLLVCEECLFKDERCNKIWSYCDFIYKGNNELFYILYLCLGLNVSIVKLVFYNW